MRPKRMVGKCPVFALAEGEFLLTVHAMERAVSRGMTINDLLGALDMPDRVVHPTERSEYYVEPVKRFLKGCWAVVVDYGAPVQVVVTVLYTNDQMWSEWNAKHGTGKQVTV